MHHEMLGIYGTEKIEAEIDTLEVVSTKIINFNDRLSNI